MPSKSSSKIASLAAERRFQLLVDAVTDCGIYMLDPDGIVASWNSGAERITGYRASEAIGEHFSQRFTREDQRTGTPVRLLDHARTQGHAEWEGWRKRKDGSRFWAVVQIDAIKDERGNFIGFANVTRDVTEREAAREALAESERQLRLLVRGVTDYALFMLDPNGVISSWNAGAERIKRYNSDEIIGRHFSIFYTPADRLAGLPRRALETAAATGRYEAEGLRVRKDGSQFWASVVMDAIRDDNGTLVGFAKITRDITEKKAAELSLRKAQDQLALQQKMEALAQLTGGVAHDFNNLLMIVGGQAEMLKRRAESERDVRALAAIDQAVKQGARLTRQMLAFARANPHARAVVNLGERVKTFRELLESSARADIAFAVNVDPDVWPVFVDPGEFDLALINLSVNARDAMPNGGSIGLQMRNAVLDDDESGMGLKGEFVAISISDTGTGIAPEHLSRVFEPFFTTKGTGKGSGLGLSQVYGFASHSGGTVQVRSEPGRGTTFTMFLPRSRLAVSDTDADAEPPVQGASRRGTVLIVEDDSRVAEVSAALVQQLGWQTIVAAGAQEALDLLARENDVVLVFSDIVMPGMDGIQLARKVRERHPGLPVLLTSGYARMAEAVADEFPILRKPYELSALARAVTGAIQSTAQGT